jgi:hypothetical protein
MRRSVKIRKRVALPTSSVTETLGGVVATASAGTAVANQYAPPATGDNADRILAVLDGREPHFSYSMPADPVTTRDVTVTTASQFNSEAATAGTLIRVNSSFSGNVSITANDIDVVMSNSATITGNLTLGGGSFANRIRWTGGNISGLMQGVRYADALFDNFQVTAEGNGAAPIDLNVPVSAVARVAFINTTFRVAGGSSSNGWALYFAGGTDLIFANIAVFSIGQNNRFMASNRLLIVDSVFNPDGASGNGMRIHDASNNVWIKDCWSRGLFKLDATNTGDTGPSVTNALFDNYDRYDNVTGYALHGSGAAWVNNNTGEVRNSSAYGATFSAGHLTNGGGNTSESWDGSTVPDYSTVGASR